MSRCCRVHRGVQAQTQLNGVMKSKTLSVCLCDLHLIDFSGGNASYSVLLLTLPRHLCTSLLVLYNKLSIAYPFCFCTFPHLLQLFILERRPSTISQLTMKLALLFLTRWTRKTLLSTMLLLALVGAGLGAPVDVSNTLTL